MTTEEARAMTTTETQIKRYLCDDGNAEIEIEAATAQAAAQAYVDGGDWGEITETTWIDVWAQEVDAGEELGDRERYTITVDPDEPACADGAEHDWQSPYEVLGGVKENPGVWGHGGGVRIKEVCASCGVYRETDTWAQRRDTGEQGLQSVEYQEADKASREWVRSRTRPGGDVR